MANRYTAQVVFQSVTGLAKDRFVNTFHFIAGGDGSDRGPERMSIAARLATFYTKIYPGAQGGLGNFLAGQILPTVAVNIYDHDQPKPRTPFVFHFTRAPSEAGQVQIPEEIALCMSFYSVRNIPTRRGRIYLGPFNVRALGPSSTVNSRPSVELINALCGAGRELMSTINGAAFDISNPLIDGLFLAGLFVDLPGAPSVPSFLQKVNFPPTVEVNWVVYSPKVAAAGTELAESATWQFVTEGWVDNEWDGQDRRRIQASARQLLSPLVVP